MPALRRPTLIVMLKVPRAGRVKTRLGQDIGTTAAAWWFRHQTARLLRRLRDPRWTIVLAVTPDREGQTSRVWPADLPRIPQGRGDLGTRMRRCLMATRGPAVLIGGDIPGVAPTHIARAFKALGSAEYGQLGGLGWVTTLVSQPIGLRGKFFLPDDRL